MTNIVVIFYMQLSNNTNTNHSTQLEDSRMEEVHGRVVL